MKKMSRLLAVILVAVGFFLLLGLTSSVGFMEFKSDLTHGRNSNWGWTHILTMWILLGACIIYLVCLVHELQTWSNDDDGIFSFLYDDDDDVDDKKEETKTFNYKKLLYWGIGLFLFFYIYGFLQTSVKDCSKIYNTSKGYQNLYTQKVQEKVGFYDKLWKTYLQKEKITNVNRETFIQVTKIIMENRKDGQQITWKFISENQQIPYSEFTKFYEDLSNFITSQREGYFNIEKECQAISNRNNTLLDTFPNNLYNKILGCQKIKFEYGFTSDSTDNIFKNKKENIK
jgi:hypothetical protein